VAFLIKAMLSRWLEMFRDEHSFFWVYSFTWRLDMVKKNWSLTRSLGTF